jgi:hypothetical protein
LQAFSHLSAEFSLVQQANKLLQPPQLKNINLNINNLKLGIDNLYIYVYIIDEIQYQICVFGGRMQTLPRRCPICGGEILITKLVCTNCDTSIEGRFTLGNFSRLTGEQLDFVETFIRCEGKINRMGAEIGLSYPTIRNRLHEIIRTLGYEPGGYDEPDELTAEERQKILDDLDKGLIKADEAMQLLKGGE